VSVSSERATGLSTGNLLGIYWEFIVFLQVPLIVQAIFAL
jgi:hypothetical protein